LSIRFPAVLTLLLPDYGYSKTPERENGEGNMNSLKRHSACSAMILFFIAGICSCSGGEKTQSETVLDELMEILDSSWELMDSPEVHSESMTEVKNAAWAVASERVFDWPRGTGFSMSVMPDHVFISVDVNGEKAEGEWKP